MKFIQCNLIIENIGTKWKIEKLHEYKNYPVKPQVKLYSSFGNLVWCEGLTQKNLGGPQSRDNDLV